MFDLDFEKAVVPAEGLLRVSSHSEIPSVRDGERDEKGREQAVDSLDLNASLGLGAVARSLLSAVQSGLQDSAVLEVGEVDDGQTVLLTLDDMQIAVEQMLGYWQSQEPLTEGNDPQDDFAHALMISVQNGLIENAFLLARGMRLEHGREGEGGVFAKIGSPGDLVEAISAAFVEDCKKQKVTGYERDRCPRCRRRLKVAAKAKACRLQISND